MNLLGNRPGSNSADIFKYAKYQQKRYKGKRHGELSCNLQKQAHKNAQAVVNSTNQDNDTTLQELIIDKCTEQGGWKKHHEFGGILNGNSHKGCGNWMQYKPKKQKEH